MDRAGWQQLADLRVLDAEALLASGRWAAAYYLAGYAVECGLKSCVLARLGREPEVIFQPKQRKFSESCWTHEIEALVKLAGLESIRDHDIAGSSPLEKSWLAVKDWNEQARYLLKSEAESRILFQAVTHATHGVLPRIKNHW